MAKQVKIRKVGDSMVVTIPKSIAESLSWDLGDQLEMGITGPKSIQLTKK